MVLLRRPKRPPQFTLQVFHHTRLVQTVSSANSGGSRMLRERIKQKSFLTRVTFLPRILSRLTGPAWGCGHCQRLMLIHLSIYKLPFSAEKRCLMLLFSSPTRSTIQIIPYAARQIRRKKFDTKNLRVTK